MTAIEHGISGDLDDDKFVGRPVLRSEDKRFLTGAGTFVDDVYQERMVHAVIARSSHAHARVAAIDTVAVKAMAGVIDVVLGEDLAELACEIPIRLGPLPGFHRFLQRPLALDTVRYVGEPVAVIIAESRYVAEDALDLLDISYVPLEPIAGVAQALQDNSVVHRAAGTNLATRYQVTHGSNIDAAFSEAPYVRKETFRCHRHTAVPLETRGLIADFDPQGSPIKLRVWGASKITFYNRDILAKLLKFPREYIEFIEVDVGGSFGVRGEFYPEDFLIPYAAMRLGRPVKWVEDRREHLMATNHSRDIECDLEIALERNGEILGLRGRLRVDMGAYVRTNGGVTPSKCAQFLPGPYRVPNIAFEIEAYVTNKTPLGTYRGPGHYEANFFRERLLDLAAADLGLSPVDIRFRNLISAAEMPFLAPKLVPHESADWYDTGDFAATLRLAVDRFDCAGLKTSENGSVRYGIGIGCFVESTGAGPFETARIELSDDGRIVVSVGLSSAGQGHETMLAQVCADELGVSLEAISVLHGTTSLLDSGTGSFHSRSAVMGGSAVFLAARQLREQILAVAARRLNSNAEELELRSGIIFRRGEGAEDTPTITLQALASAARELAPDSGSDKAALEATARFEQTIKTFPYGTHIAHVAVDLETGKVDVLRYLIVEDIGRCINPLIVHGQVIGAAVQGIGATFLDEHVYDEDAQLLTGSLADYLVATATDFPNVEAITLELAPSKLNPLGVKGAGEGGIVAAGAALANAVADAISPLGVKVLSLPLNPNVIRRLLREAHAELEGLARSTKTEIPAASTGAYSVAGGGRRGSG